jgi:hypothetical protein
MSTATAITSLLAQFVCISRYQVCIDAHACVLLLCAYAKVITDDPRVVSEYSREYDGLVCITYSHMSVVSHDAENRSYRTRYLHMRYLCIDAIKEFSKSSAFVQIGHSPTTNSSSSSVR